MTTCLLFDSDGTLVDSESINMRALADELALQNIVEDPNALLGNYRGWRIKQVLEDLGKRHKLLLDAAFEKRFRQRASDYFDRDLQPVSNIKAALTQLGYPKCVASNAPMAKLVQVLTKTQLDLFFDGKLFSAYEIASFKPDPGLFLHAANSMGFDPANCVVIEDSLVGVQAAMAANMHCVLYHPGDAAEDPKLSALLNDSAGCITHIGNMLELPAAIEAFGL